jgi:hypothetical protein
MRKGTPVETPYYPKILDLQGDANWGYGCQFLIFLWSHSGETDIGSFVQ